MFRFPYLTVLAAVCLSGNAIGQSPASPASDIDRITQETLPLVVAWRRVDAGWEAYVATWRESSVLVTWEKAAALRPVRDDRPARP